MAHLPRPLSAAGAGGGPSGGAGPSAGAPGGAGPPGGVGPSGGGGGRAGPSGGGAAGGAVEDAYREAREAITEARQAVEEEREHFQQISRYAKNELGEFHTLATDALKALVSGFDRSLRDTVVQLRSSLQRGMLQSSSLCTQFVQNPACKERHIPNSCGPNIS